MDTRTHAAAAAAVDTHNQEEAAAAEAEAVGKHTPVAEDKVLQHVCTWPEAEDKIFQLPAPPPGNGGGRLPAASPDTANYVRPSGTPPLVPQIPSPPALLSSGSSSYGRRRQIRWRTHPSLEWGSYSSNP